MTTSKKQPKSMNGQPMNELIFQSIMGEYLIHPLNVRKSKYTKAIA